MLRAAAFFFIFVAGVTVTKSATNALFLTRRDPEDLPYLYLCTAVAVTVVTVALGRRLARTSAKIVLIGAVWRAAGVLTVLGALSLANVPGALGGLYVAGEVYATALSVLFWARLGEMFDVRSAKRVFGGIAAAGMGGAVAGGIALRLFASVLPGLAWCLLAAASLVLVRPLLGRASARAVERPTTRFVHGLRYAVQDGFPRGLAVLVWVLAVQSAVIDYVFRVGAARTYVTDESSLTALFGVLHAVVGVGALAVQAFGTGPLLRRFGVFAFLSCIPVLCLGLSALLWWQPQVFALIFALKAFEMMGSLSLNQPAIGILYNPMPLGMRDAVRAVIDGAIKKFGGAVGGGLLLVVGAQKPAIGLVGVLAALLIWRIYRLRPRYWAALSAKLAASEVPALLSIDPSDRATRQKLLTALDADDVQTVLRALDILARHPGSELPLYLIRLLTHARSVVRRRAIALIREAPQQRYAPYLEKIIGAGGAQPKGPAAEALVAVDRSTALRVLTPYLDARTMAQDPDLACIAIWVALDADDPNVVARAHRRLAAMVELSGAPVVRRRAVAALLGRLGAGPTAAALAPLLDDEDAAVRQAAVKSAASTRHSSLMRGLIVRLGDPPLWRDAAAALCAYGDDAASMLAQTLVDDAMPMHVRLKVPFVLQRIGSDTAAQALLLLGVEQGVQLRFEAMQALFRLRGGRPALVVDPGQIERGVHRCLEDYGRFEGIATDLAAGGPAFALVARAVAARQKQSVLAAVMLLGLIVDYEAIERSVAGIRAGLMPDALELLDATLRGTGLRKAVLAGLEPRPHTAQPGAATSRAAALIDGDDRLVAELAHRTLRRIGGHAARAAGKRPMLRAESKSSGLPEATIDRLFVLEGVPLFQGLSVDVLVKVASIMEQGWTKPHEAVYQQGEPGDAMFVVIAGEIRLFKDDTPLLDLGVGEAFGQVSLLDRGLRPVSARAQEEGVEYLILKRRPLMQLLADEPSLMNGMFIELARRLRELVALSVPSDGSTRPMPPIPPTVTGPTIHLPLTVRSSTIGRS